MGKDLAECYPHIGALLDRANLDLECDLRRLCFEGPEAELTKSEYAQPAIFLVSWVAFRLLREQVPGLRFEATAGLSLGEFTALTAADALGFDDGLRIVRQRGRFMQEACDATHGAMAAIIGLDEAATRAVCAEAGVELANLNCPGQLVISGEAEAVARACDLAKARGARRALPLPVAGAFHSRLMASAQRRLAAVLDTTPLQPTAVPVIANVTAQPHGDPAAMRARLVEQVTGSVRWEESIRYLLARGFTRFIELGPGTALSGFLRRIDKQAQVLNVADVPSLAATVKSLTT
jgi:[acyl-carrier-protein] S-malonyltransferase